MEFTHAAGPACFLVDNGSLQPAATLTLRELAGAVGARLGRRVEPVSLLHSNKVPAAHLGGTSAEILEPAVRARYAEGVRRFIVLPLFFGPSGALTEYIPQRVQELRQNLPDLELFVASPVAGNNAASPDPRLGEILADHVRATIAERRIDHPAVVMVDHGSPQRAVALVRDRVAEQLRARLGADAVLVIAASMERREGPAYAFNEPLLARAIEEIASGKGRARDLVIAPLFFSAGRHAGPGGDIETIAREASAGRGDLRVHVTRLVGEHPRLIEILADRYREASKQMGR